MISDIVQLPAPVGPIAAGTEFVAITNVVDSGAGGQFAQGRLIRGVLNVTVGAAGTSFTVRVRQNSLTGPVVGTVDTNTFAAAATPVSVAFSKNDQTVAGAGTYVVTVTGVGGTGTVNDGTLEVCMPTPYGANV